MFRNPSDDAKISRFIIRFHPQKHIARTQTFTAIFKQPSATDITYYRAIKKIK